MEMDSLHSNKVWELVEPPADRKVVGSKWIFKRKVDADGTVERYKACLVAQTKGLDLTAKKPSAQLFALNQ